MKAELWSLVEDLFASAAGLPEDERKVFLDQACEGHPTLRKEVESLLTAQIRAGSDPDFLETGAGLAAAENLPEFLESDQLGSYRILSRVGQGGMSTVYLAVRGDGEYQKRVAIKVPRPEFSSFDALRRLRTERQILAGLDHPHIAQFLDGGSTSQGRPYFVMEFIEGETIDVYCDRRRLSLEARLDLFRKVCFAVHYAHQNLVIHRDLKPGNVLVATEGTPKLVDFGIAKLLRPELFPGHLEVTAPWVRHLTPDYASPEQLEGRTVTTATDIYSLGVLLFQLLTGSLPFDRSQEARSEADPLGTHEEAPLPSAVVIRSNAEQEESKFDDADQRAKRRASDPKTLGRRLQGDLDTIVAMALRYEPQRRYDSAEQFAADIERYLTGLPVLARPATARYRLGKFVRRHRWAVLTGVLSFLLLAVSTGLLAIQSAKISRERDRAALERDRARQLTKTMDALFWDAGPDGDDGRAMTSQQLLDRALERLEGELPGQPEIQASMLETIGTAYAGLGFYDQAASALGRSLDLRLQSPEGAAAVAQSQVALGRLYWHQGRFQEAEEHLHRALSQQQGDSDSAKAAAAEAHNELGNLLTDLERFEEAESELLQSLDLTRKAQGRDHSDVARVHNNLAVVYTYTGRYDLAVQSLRESLRVKQSIFGAEHRSVAASWFNLGQVLRYQGKLEEAEETLQRSLESRRRILGPDHPEVAFSLGGLAALARERGDLKRAFELIFESLGVLRRSLGEKHADVGRTLNNLGTLSISLGRPDEAEGFLQQALAIQVEAFGEEHPQVARSLNNLALAYREVGRSEEAEEHFRRSLAMRRKLLGSEDPVVGHSLVGLAALLSDRGRLEEAETLLLEAVELWGEALPSGDLRLAEAESLLGDCHARSGRFAAAEPLLLSAFRDFDEATPVPDKKWRQALERLVRFYQASGDLAAAERYQARMERSLP
ncbi:MAG: serine/threonine-protein kinase [Deltaproteobacteria bacterium]|nr:serine/threonine-protein kinase [Deltaproteobacteria bacterium]